MGTVTMAWFFVIINALGILTGFAEQSTVSIILFGVSFLALFPVYEKLTWEHIMSHLVAEFSITYYTHHRLTNGLVTVIVMTGIYVICAKRLGMQCILIPMFQCILYGAWNMVEGKKPKKFVAMVCYCMELILSFVLLILN